MKVRDFSFRALFQSDYVQVVYISTQLANCISYDDPPPDPDEAPVASSSKGKGKEKKPAEMREINVSTRKTDDKGMTQGLSTVRREMLQIIRAEEEEEWLNYEYHNVTVRNIFTGVPVLTSGI